MFELARRQDLIMFFRDLSFIKNFKKPRMVYTDNFTLKRNEGLTSVVTNNFNEFYLTPNFSNALKISYMYKFVLEKKIFVEKLFILNKNGLLLCYDDPNVPPSKFIKLKGCKLNRIDEKVFKKKHCFEIVSNLNTQFKEVYIFAAINEEELNTWLLDIRLFVR